MKYINQSRNPQFRYIFFCESKWFALTHLHFFLTHYAIHTSEPIRCAIRHLPNLRAFAQDPFPTRL